MEELIGRMWEDLASRVGGPFTFRFVLQPVMAIVYAIRDGVHDARSGRPPYFWAIFTRPDDRLQLLREGCAAVGRVIALGIVMDVLYQVIVIGWVYPGEMLIIVLLLALLPYVLVRGPVNRIARVWSHRTRRPA
jgi:hypothetical protein